MSDMLDVTADQPSTTGRLAVQDLVPEEVASLAEELVAYHRHFAALFSRREQREWAAVYLHGLLTADVPRKNVEAMALRLLGVGSHAEQQVRALQQFIGEGRWDDEAILAEHQRLVNETLGEEDGVLIIDGSDFPKHGQHAAGVAPQWCGNTGKKENCQAGVVLGYASRKGATLLDRRLYLPESWFDEDHQRRWQDCQIPEETPFQTKQELAAQLVEDIMASGRLQAQWVACDEGYGDSPAFLQRLDATGLWYLAEVPPDSQVWPLLETDGKTERARASSWVPPQTPSHKGPAPQRERLHPASPAKVPLEDLAKQWPSSAWQRFRLLEAHKGPLVADFLVLRAVFPLDRLPGPEVWVVIGRKVSGEASAEPEGKFYLSNAPIETPLSTFVRVSGMRWPIETCFAECKGELGMDQYEVRFWLGWHHHMTLVILAHHFLVRWQQRLKQRGGGPAPHNDTSLAHAS
jgi:SRSO17 transposase